MAGKIKTSMRYLHRIFYLLIVISSANLAFSIYGLSQLPYVDIYTERSAEEIRHLISQEMDQNITDYQLTTRLETLLAEDNRDWVEIASIRSLMAERNILLSDDLQARYDLALEEDQGLRERAKECLACLWDAGECKLSPELACQGVAVISPVGDVVGIVKQSKNAITGDEVDKLDLALSSIGLTASIGSLFTAGTTLPVKVGASLARLARRMRLLSNGMTRYLEEMIDDIIRLSKNAKFESARIRAAEFMEPLGRLNASIGTLDALHIVRYANNSQDLRKMARVSEVEKNKVVAELDLLGKKKVLKTALRLSDNVIYILYSLAGVMLSIIGVFFKSIINYLVRILRRKIREVASE